MQGQLFKCLQELIAIVLGLATFLPDIKGKKVIVYSDNKGAVLGPRVPACSLLPAAGAELSTARGSAKAADHNGIVHAIWACAFAYKVQLWLVRVPSEQNISDSPSRGDHRLLSELGAQWRHPVWDLCL